MYQLKYRHYFTGDINMIQQNKEEKQKLKTSQAVAEMILTEVHKPILEQKGKYVPERSSCCSACLCFISSI